MKYDIQLSMSASCDILQKALTQHVSQDSLNSHVATGISTERLRIHVYPLLLLLKASEILTNPLMSLLADDQNPHTAIDVRVTRLWNFICIH